MQGTEALSNLLLLALALVMLGLGLSLRLEDFTRLRQHPRAVVLALVLQMLVLPGLCWLLIRVSGLPPPYAIGLMLLAASPGGVSANLFSHLFGGHVALNISLTAINTVLSMISLPLLTQWAIRAFADDPRVLPMQTGKVVEVVLLVIGPVALGMLLAGRWPALAARLERPFKAFSALVLGGFAMLAIVREWERLLESALSLGGVVLLFNVLSLGAGFFGSRLAGLPRPMAIAISYEIGIHNSTLAIYLALNALKDYQMALPAAVYSVSMYLVALVFGLAVLRRQR